MIHSDADLFFLPDWPLRIDGMPWFALLLLAATVVGEATKRYLRLPAVLGWIAVGLAAGPHAFGVVDADVLAGLDPLLDVAVGIVLFELGQRVDPRWLGRNPWLLAVSVLESLLAFVAMFAVLLLLDAPILVSACAAAIGIATAPAVNLALVRDLRADGQVTERILLLTAMNNVYAFVATSMLLAWLAREYSGGVATTLGHPLYLIFGSVLLAVALAGATLGLLRALGRRHHAQFICVLSLIVMAVWLATTFRLSSELALLSFGALLRILDRRRAFLSLDFGRLGTIFLTLLFVLTAARVDTALLATGAAAGAALIAARYLGKAAGVLALARPSAISVRRGSLVALGLMPMSGLAVVLVQQTAAHFPEFAPSLASVVVSAIVMLELLGPLLAHFAIVRAGEAGDDWASR